MIVFLPTYKYFTRNILTPVSYVIVHIRRERDSKMSCGTPVSYVLIYSSPYVLLLCAVLLETYTEIL